jgi:hypothetical protein
MTIQAQVPAFGALLLFQSEMEVNRNREDRCSRFTAQQGQSSSCSALMIFRQAPLTLRVRSITSTRGASFGSAFAASTTARAFFSVVSPSGTHLPILKTRVDENFTEDDEKGGQISPS